jgi:Trk-type K+ transport system membrane component
MMYISAYPIAITIRNSNVYEERSLGIYADDPYYQTWDEHEKYKRRQAEQNTALRHLHHFWHSRMRSEGSRWYFVQQQFRAQLAHDLWWLVLAVWLIVIIETGQFDSDPAAFSVFNVLFEVVSGYGTVGISIGAPGQNYSFCGAWHATSKLILCAVMLRGRHRGLPVAIDKAILLPTEAEEAMMFELEEEDARRRHHNDLET